MNCSPPTPTPTPNRQQTYPLSPSYTKHSSKENQKNRDNFAKNPPSKNRHKKRNHIFDEYQGIKLTKEKDQDKGFCKKAIKTEETAATYQAMKEQGCFSGDMQKHKVLDEGGKVKNKKLRIFEKGQLRTRQAKRKHEKVMWTEEAISSTKRLIEKIESILPQQDHINSSIIITELHCPINTTQNNINTGTKHCQAVRFPNNPTTFTTTEQASREHQLAQQNETNRFTSVFPYKHKSYIVDSHQQKSCLSVSQHMNPIFSKIKSIRVHARKLTADDDQTKRSDVKLHLSVLKKSNIDIAVMDSGQNHKQTSYSINDRYRDSLINKSHAQAPHIQAMKSNRYFDSQNKVIGLNKKLSFKNIKIEHMDQHQHEEENHHNIFNDFQERPGGFQRKTSIEIILSNQQNHHQRLTPLLKRTNSQQFTPMDNDYRRDKNNYMSDNKDSKEKLTSSADQTGLKAQEQLRIRGYQQDNTQGLCKHSLSLFLLLLVFLLLAIQAVN